MERPVVVALGKAFHPDCFACCVCNNVLEGRFFSEGGKAFRAAHAGVDSQRPQLGLLPARQLPQAQVLLLQAASGGSRLRALFDAGARFARARASAPAAPAVRPGTAPGRPPR